MSATGVWRYLQAWALSWVLVGEGRGRGLRLRGAAGSPSPPEQRGKGNCHHLRRLPEPSGRAWFQPASRLVMTRSKWWFSRRRLLSGVVVNVWCCLDREHTDCIVLFGGYQVELELCPSKSDPVSFQISVCCLDRLRNGVGKTQPV